MTSVVKSLIDGSDPQGTLTDITDLAKCASVLLVWMACQPACALTKNDDIETNRPSFCQSAFVVPEGTIQLENGGLYQHSQHGVSYFQIPETEVRIGLLKKTELQVSPPMFAALLTKQENLEGVTDLSEIGLKHQIGPKNKFVASLVGSLSVPTGKSEFGSNRVRTQFRIPYAYAVTSRWSIVGMQSLTLFDNGHSTSYQPFVMISRSFGERARTTAFVEYAGFFNTRLPDVQIAHFGGAHRLNKNHQLDLHFGFGLNRNSPAAFVGTGYSFRFDSLPFGN